MRLLMIQREARLNRKANKLAMEAKRLWAKADALRATLRLPPRIKQPVSEPHAGVIEIEHEGFVE